MAFDLKTFFEKLNTYNRWNVAVAIDRTNSLPLDANSIFASKVLAEKYAKGLVGANAEYTGTKEEPIYTYPGAEAIMNNAYPGQIIAVVSAETVEVYYIDANRNLQEVGAKVNFNEDDFVVNEDGTISLAKLPEVVEATEGAIAVTKNDEGNYELNLKLVDLPYNIASIDVDDEPGLFVPAPGYTKGDKATLGENVETVDVLVELAGTNTANLKGNYITTYTPYGIEKRIAEAGHASLMVAESIDTENKTYTDAQGNTYPVVKNVIYLIKDDSVQGSDVYFEYALVNYTDEEGGIGQELLLIGDTSTDLSNYYDKNAINDKFGEIVIPTQEDFGILNISTDNIGALIIDRADKQKPIINLVLNNEGNVKLEDTATGLKASVEFPEVTIPDIIIGERTTTAEKNANTALVIQQLEVDDENGHKLIETPIEVVTKDILKDTGLVNPEKVFAQQIVWRDNGDGSELEYQEATLATVLGQLAYASKSDGGVLIGTAGLMSAADKYKLDKLVIGEDGEVGISGTISADNVLGLQDKVINIVTGTAVDQLGIDPGAQVNKIEKIKVDGTELAIAGADKSVTIPLATDVKAGLAKSSNKANQISYTTNGAGEVNFVTTDKLLQVATDELVLFGGKSSTLIRICIMQGENNYYIDCDNTMKTWKDLDGYSPICPEGHHATIHVYNNLDSGIMMINIDTGDGIDVEHTIYLNREQIQSSDPILVGPYEALDD